jgi:hypothetical protein
MLEFEREKHARLNEVMVEVALRVHQVQSVLEQTHQQQEPAAGGCAASGDVLVLSQASLETLAARIQVRDC